MNERPPSTQNREVPPATPCEVFEAAYDVYSRRLGETSMAHRDLLDLLNRKDLDEQAKKELQHIRRSILRLEDDLIKLGRERLHLTNDQIVDVLSARRAT